MPASYDEVVRELNQLTCDEDVFAITKISNKSHGTAWSLPNGTLAHNHAEYRLAQQLKDYEIEEGEIVDIDITLKWSPCGWCAMELQNLLSTFKSRARGVGADVSMTVYYLNIYHDKSGIDAWEVMQAAGIPCVQYGKTDQGKWWPGQRHRWNYV